MHINILSQVNRKCKRFPILFISYIKIVYYKLLPPIPLQLNTLKFGPHPLLTFSLVCFRFFFKELDKALKSVHDLQISFIAHFISTIISYRFKSPLLQNFFNTFITFKSRYLRNQKRFTPYIVEQLESV